MQSDRGSVYMKKTIAVLTSIILTFAMAIPTLAITEQTSRSMVIYATQGDDVTLTKGTDKSFTAKKGMRLSNGYTVSTGKASYADLKLDDETLLKMDESTKVDISQTKGKNLKLTLLSGAISVNAAKQKDSETISVRAGNSALAVRGTVFALSYSGGVFEVDLFEGAVGVDTPKDSYTLTEGNRIIVTDGKTEHETGDVTIEPLDLTKLDSFSLKVIEENKELLIEKGIIGQDDADRLSQLISDKEKVEQEAKAANDKAIADVNKEIPGSNQNYKGTIASGGGGGGGSSSQAPTSATAVTITSYERGLGFYAYRNMLKISDHSDIRDIEITVKLANGYDEADNAVPSFTDTLTYTENVYELVDSSLARRYPVDTNYTSGNYMYFSLPAVKYSDNTQIYGIYTVEVKGSDGHVKSAAVNVSPAVSSESASSPGTIRKYSTVEEGILAGYEIGGSSADTITVIGSGSILADIGMGDGDKLIVPYGSSLTLAAKLGRNSPSSTPEPEITFETGSSVAIKSGLPNPFYRNNGSPLDKTDVIGRTFIWDGGVWENTTVARLSYGGASTGYSSLEDIQGGVSLTVSSGEVLDIIDDCDTFWVLTLTVDAGGTLNIQEGVTFTSSVSMPFMLNGDMVNDGAFMVDGNMTIGISATLTGSAGASIGIGGSGNIIGNTADFYNMPGPNGFYTWDSYLGKWF